MVVLHNTTSPEHAVYCLTLSWRYVVGWTVRQSGTWVCLLLSVHEAIEQSNSLHLDRYDILQTILGIWTDGS